ncbi:MAG: DUF523 and DUF1722 domain-containing protein [Candidatus Gracilibacteria bacterium]|nr:DUF523 and DUF1722 domain-containing protein [Candidatus Gracilibacteria bacterium]MCP4524090.1 DUF523 and DUF1722 domain-containing protein [Candidatus Gracilibacteria bacterium]
MKFARPKLLVSKCLEFDSCRYNGMRLNSPLVYKLQNFVDFIPVCPEVAIGLGIPRTPIRMINIEKDLRLQEVGTNKDFTHKMNKFSSDFFDTLDEIDGAILKSRSPSCALKDAKINNGDTGLEKIEHLKAGFFAKYLYKHFPFIPKEDEGRILSYKIRDEFLIKIFIFSEWREIRKNHNISSLITFHTKHKYMLMSYDQNELHKLGNIVACYDKNNGDEVFRAYERFFQELFLKTRTQKNFLNAISHMFGYFKNNISSQEKQFFLDTVELYKEDRVPTGVLIHMIKGWAIAYNNDYILKQSILNPYPKELIELSDSGKKIKI